MNMGRTSRVVAFAALLVAWGTASAQKEIPGWTGSDYNPPQPEWRGQAGMTFLQIGGSARAEGMGGAFNGAKGDPAAIFYNPAGMASLGMASVYANQTSWLAGMTVTHFAGAGRVGPVVIGGTFVNMDYGTIEGAQIVAASVDQRGYQRTNVAAPETWAGGVLGAAQLTDRFSVGVHVRYVVQDFSPSKMWSFGQNKYLDAESRNRVGVFSFDMGTQYVTGLRNIALNMSLQNFSSPQQFVEIKFDLPLTYRVGLSAEMFQLVTGNELAGHKLMVYADGMEQKDVSLDVAAGAEYLMDLSQFAPGLEVGLRAGRRAARIQDGWMSFGGSVQFGMSSYAARFDYAYNDYGPGLSANRVGLSLTMD